jgi:hypothetical protein
VAAIVARVKGKDAVDAVDMEKAVKAEIATEMGNRVSAPIAKLTAILQMHAENGNALRREEIAEETMSAFATSTGSQATSKSIASPTNV